MRLTSLTPPEIAPPFARYAHGMRLDGPAGIVLTSGQLAMAPDGSIPETAQAQAQLIFSNIDQILAAGGTSRAHLLRLNAYVTDRAHMSGYMSARDDWIAGLAHPPASTLMIVSGFTRPEFLVEIEAMAAVPAP